MNNREIKVNLVFFSHSLSLPIIGKVKASQEEAGSLEKSSSVVSVNAKQCENFGGNYFFIFCETLIIVGEAV